MSTEWGYHRNINEGQEAEGREKLNGLSFSLNHVQSVERGQADHGYVSLKMRTRRALKFRSYSQLCWGK